MAHVARGSSARKPIPRSASTSHGADFIRWVAGGIPLHAEPGLPVRIAVHPDLGVLVHPEATAEELTGAIWLYLRAQGLHAVDVEARALILPTARRRLRTVRRKAKSPAPPEWRDRRDRSRAQK